jgi:transposase-like protein
MGTQYPKERKDAIINKMLPPQSMTVPELAQLENIPLGTLYTWRTQYLNHHNQEITPMASSNTPRSASQKLTVIIETSSLNEQGLSEYCRKNGLFTSDIDGWKADFIKSAKNQSASNKEDKVQLKQLRIDNKSLKKELRRKEKALAEAAALLVLRKKWDALWEESEDE